MTALQHARRYASEGFPVFPVWPMAGGASPKFGGSGKCICQLPTEKCHPGKHPMLPNGLNGASLDVEQLTAWFSIGYELNVGVAVPDGVVVVDVDPRNGGDRTFAELQRLFGMPETRVVRTGGGGIHLYYRVPAGLRFPAHHGSGIDLKQLGGYVLAPPSNHESGGHYSWAVDREMAAAPEWLVALGSARGAPVQDEVEFDFDPKRTEGWDLDEAARLLVPWFVHGQMHRVSVALGGVIKARGGTTADAIALLNALCGLTDGKPHKATADAVGAFRYATPPAWSWLREHGVSEEVLQRVGTLLPARAGSRAAAREEEGRAAATAALLALGPAQNGTPAVVSCAAAPPATLPILESSSVEMVGREEVLKLARSLKTKKRSFEEQQRGRAIEKALMGQLLADDPQAAAALALAIASDLARQFPLSTVDYSLFASSFDRSGVSLEAFRARAAEEQRRAREMAERRSMTHERRRATGLALDPDGNPKNCLSNVATILETDAAWDGVLGYDLLGYRTVLLKPPPIDIDNGFDAAAWKNAGTNRVRRWIHDSYGFEPAKDNTDGAVDLVSRKRSFHPVRDYLNRLAWDGVRRIDWWWTAYLGAPADDWHRVIGAKFLIGCVARAMICIGEGGVVEACKLDTVPVLEGPQGLFKSTAIRVLAGGDKWFNDTKLDIGNKDAVQQLDGVWIAELADLSGVSRARIDECKAFLSSKVDNIRRAYASRAEKEPRQCAFTATTNDHEYLHDPTGARRFWPVRCGVRAPIDIAGIRRDRDQLWAEAVVRFYTRPSDPFLSAGVNGPGERWWLDGDEHVLALDEQEQRTEVDPWEVAAAAWIARQPDLATEGVTTTDLLDHLLETGNGQTVARQDRAGATRVGHILRKLGFEVRRVRADGSRQRRYFRIGTGTADGNVTGTAAGRAVSEIREARAMGVTP